MIDSAADVADAIVHCLRAEGLDVHDDQQVAEEMKNSPLSPQELGEELLGYYFMGVTLPDGTGVSISVNVTP